MKAMEIKSKTLLRKQKRPDSWFLTKFGMNLYRGCEHNCMYCDGQSEKYQVNGQFESQIEVKINAPELLEKELSRLAKKREKPGFIGLVGGVSDAYQPLEKEYKLTRKILEILENRHYPVMILTKSRLIERDLDLLKKINEKTNALVGMSFSSVNDEISRIFEPGVEIPSERLKTLKKIKDAGIKCGIFLMPLIPFITDNYQEMTKVFQKARELDLDFIVSGGMTIKFGRQRDKYFDILEEYFPDLIPEYEMIYKNNKYGNAIEQYYQSLNAPMLQLSSAFKIPLRIPFYGFDRQFTLNEKVIIMLEQMDYLLKMRGQQSPYRYAAHNLTKLKEPIEQHQYLLQSIKGIGPKTERIIQEIIRTNQCVYYNCLLNNCNC